MFTRKVNTTIQQFAGGLVGFYNASIIVVITIYTPTSSSQTSADINCAGDIALVIYGIGHHGHADISGDGAGVLNSDRGFSVVLKVLHHLAGDATGGEGVGQAAGLGGQEGGGQADGSIIDFASLSVSALYSLVSFNSLIIILLYKLLSFELTSNIFHKMYNCQ